MSAHLQEASPPFAAEWQKARNILCIRLDAMGDVLMTTPAFRALKESHPDRQLTLLTSKAGAQIAPLIPEIDRTLVYEPPWMKATKPRASSLPEMRMIHRLAYSKYDAAIIFTVFSQNPLPAAMLAYMADIPLRLAYCRENPYQLLTDWQIEVDHFNQSDIRHEVQRQLDLVASIGCKTENLHLSLNVHSNDLQRLIHRFQNIALDVNKPWLVIHPGASAASRRYPPEYFAAVARELISKFGFQVLFTGTEPERDLVESIRSDIPCGSFSLTGDLDTAALVALIHLAPLLIANNSGPVHIAAAVGTPVVDLYALTNPQHTPWRVPHRTLSHDVPCRNCYKSVCPMGHHNCLRLVSPEQVVQAALSLFIESRMFRKQNLQKDSILQKTALPFLAG